MSYTDICYPGITCLYNWHWSGRSPALCIIGIAARKTLVQMPMPDENALRMHHNVSSLPVAGGRLVCILCSPARPPLHRGRGLLGLSASAGRLEASVAPAAVQVLRCALDLCQVSRICSASQCKLLQWLDTEACQSCKAHRGLIAVPTL